MRPLVHLCAADAAKPEDAVRECTSWVFDAAPARRGLVTLFLAPNNMPGATITPWCLRGLDAAIPMGIASRSYWARGDLDTAQQVLDAAELPVHVRAQTHALRNAARMKLTLPGFRRAAAIPRDFVGRNLVIVAPVSHRRDTSAGFLGPSQSALAALAQMCRLEGSSTALAKAGARIAGEAFATATLLLDATWWAPLDASGRPVAEAVAIEHFLCTPSLGRRGGARAIDNWVGRLLGHPPTRAEMRRGQNHTPRIAGQRRPWPSAPLPGQLGTSGREARRPPGSSFGGGLRDRSKELRQHARGLANRAFDALWTRPSDSTTARLALTAPVPGNFAERWAREMGRRATRPYSSHRPA